MKILSSFALKYPIDINDYWAGRKDHDLYTLTNAVAKSFFFNANSAIDVGSYIGGLICDLDWIDERVATDIHDLTQNWKEVEGVNFIAGDAFKLEFSRRFDLVISNQTIEHLERPSEFVEKLLSIGKGLILTTTFETPHGLIQGHIQDPIDMNKFKSWFPCRLDGIAICYHPTNKSIGHIIGVVNQSHPNLP